MTFSALRRARLAPLPMVLAATLGSAARADDDGGGRAAAPLLPAYVQECGACHLPYPPGLLPAASWQRLMGGLPRHFGTDASLEPTMQAALAAWLSANAGTSKRVRRDPAPPPEDRITRASWFQREHRKVDASTWKLPAVKSPSHCAACHGGADRGDFDEHQVRIPR